MTLNLPLKTQLEELENTTLYDALLQQRQNLAAIGQRYTDIVWAAGLFEGEGSIPHSHTRPKLMCVSLKMTDEDVMKKFVSIVGYGNLCGPHIDKKGNKPFYAWQVRKRSEVLRILKMFLPHFGIRRADRAIEVIRFINEIID